MLFDCILSSGASLLLCVSCGVLCCSLLGCVCSLCVARLFCIGMIVAVFCLGLWVGWDVWLVRLHFGQSGVVLLWFVVL